MEVEKDEKDSDEAPPLKEKEKSSTEEIYNKIEEKGEGKYLYETIVDHWFENGILKLKVKYCNKINGKDNVVEVSFGIMTKDEPVSLAKYIKRYVVEASRWSGTFNVWTTKVLKENARAIRWLYHIREVDKAFRIGGTK
eukprot:14663099-Ditylum_brightwellii.AAC.1